MNSNSNYYSINKTILRDFDHLSSYPSILLDKKKDKDVDIHYSFTKNVNSHDMLNNANKKQTNKISLYSSPINTKETKSEREIDYIYDNNKNNLDEIEEDRIQDRNRFNKYLPDFLQDFPEDNRESFEVVRNHNLGSYIKNTSPFSNTSKQNNSNRKINNFLLTRSRNIENYNTNEDIDKDISTYNTTEYSLNKKYENTKSIPELNEFNVNTSEYIFTDTVNREQFKENEIIFDDMDTNCRESFQNATNISTGDHTYISILESYAIMIVQYVNKNKDFEHWCDYWNYLECNLNKCRGLFERLECSDADVAYVEDKGRRMRFRIRDNTKYVPLSIYVYVLVHELAHLANGDEYGHTAKFTMLMNLLEVAAFELGILKVEKYPLITYRSNNTPILSKSSIKSELENGIYQIIKHGGNDKFYNDMLTCIRNK